jgi:hypothetical protein
MSKDKVTDVDQTGADDKVWMALGDIARYSGKILEVLDGLEGEDLEVVNMRAVYETLTGLLTDFLIAVENSEL